MSPTSQHKMDSAKRQRRTPSFSHSINGKLVQIDISSSFFELPKTCVSDRLLLDCLYRIFFRVVCQHDSKEVSFAAAVPAFDIPKFGHKSISILADNDSFVIRVFCDVLSSPKPPLPLLLAHIQRLIEDWVSASNDSGLAATLESCQRSLEDQHALREQMQQQGGVAFLANGSLLVGRKVGQTVGQTTCVPFQAPPSLEKTFSLPHREVRGLLVRAGVNVIVGGGFHGKSTLLTAIREGAHDKLAGDGAEFVVTVRDLLDLRIEEGRAVHSVDISPFFKNLPPLSGIHPHRFSTTCASGSTSMASSAVEGVELGASLLLLDEDSCATNFLIQDSRMRSLVANESIIPYIYRVNGLADVGVSTIIVVGGCGDWCDVQDCTLIMDNYHCADATQRAHSITHTFCAGRVQFNGRGLVHQLPWPAGRHRSVLFTRDHSAEGSFAVRILPDTDPEDKDRPQQQQRQQHYAELERGLRTNAVEMVCDLLECGYGSSSGSTSGGGGMGSGSSGPECPLKRMLLNFTRQWQGRGAEGTSSADESSCTGMFLALLCLEAIHHADATRKKGKSEHGIGNGSDGDRGEKDMGGMIKGGKDRKDRGIRLRTLLRLYGVLLEQLYPPGTGKAGKEVKEEEEEEEQAEVEVEVEKSRRCLEMLAAAVGSSRPVCLPSERELGLFVNRHRLEVSDAW